MKKKKKARKAFGLLNLQELLELYKVCGGSLRLTLYTKDHLFSHSCTDTSAARPHGPSKVIGTARDPGSRPTRGR